MTIQVFRPDGDTALEASEMPFAPRPSTEDDDQLIIGIVENGKARSRAFLVAIADQIAERSNVSEIVVVGKPSAGKLLEAAEAEDLAARAHVILTGVGD